MSFEGPTSTTLMAHKGCSFEDLCCGTALNYACDYTLDITGKDFEHSKRAIGEHIYHCINRLEANRKRKVKRLYIGKSYLQLKVVQSDPRSWPYENDGIYSRWLKHKCEEYGRDGMVVLTVITKDCIPENAEPGLGLEDYTLALEQALLHHFKITYHDPRIANQSLATGRMRKNKQAAYAIYMTFTLEDPDSPSSLLGPLSSTSPPPSHAHSSASLSPGYHCSSSKHSPSNPVLSPIPVSPPCVVKHAPPPTIQFDLFT